jgi:nitric oxide reductase NorD protein
VPVAQIRSLEGFRSGRRLATMLRGNDALASAFQAAQAALDTRNDVAELAAWDETALALFEANLGDVTLRIFLELSGRWPREHPLADLVAVGGAARLIGREAGSRSAQTLLVAWPRADVCLRASAERRVVLDALIALAEAAPESVVLVLGRLEQLLAEVAADDFAAWIAGGLRAAGGSTARRRAFFSLDDPLSTRLLSLGRAGGDFIRLERRLAAGMAAMWNRRPRFRKLPPQALPVPRRTSLIGGLVGLPDSFPGFEGAQAQAIYRAATAHAGAHFVHSSVRFPVGKLKPLQLALVSLIEDARVEALALRAMPGLRRLWLPFHATQPSDHTTAAGLMVRLARGLIDPRYEDGDAWIAKGRALFAEAAHRIHDPAISREIGGLLGNDLGQMRLQFNARTYVIEPAYRDDNLALWDFGDQPDAPTEEIELLVDSVRIERRDEVDGKRSEETTPDNAQRARGRAVASLEGIPVATYPEWDYAAGVERPDWVTILEADAPTLGNTTAPPSESGEASRHVAALTRDASIGRRIRTKGQREGETLDIDAAITLMAERRAGFLPEARVYQRDVPGPRDVAVLLLLDLSQSTADRDRHGRQILAVEREAAAIMAAAMQEAGDAIAVHGFSSEGRERVRYLRIKDFAEPLDAVVRARLAALTSSHSTRLGSALRHAGRYLARRRAFRRVLLVLTDGEPSDIDVEDPLYLAEDARRAVLQLRRDGIDSFAFGMGGGSLRLLDRIFGGRRTLRVPRIDVLPAQLMHLYGELKK